MAAGSDGVIFEERRKTLRISGSGHKRMDGLLGETGIDNTLVFGNISFCFLADILPLKLPC